MNDAVTLYSTSDLTHPRMPKMAVLGVARFDERFFFFVLLPPIILEVCV